MSARVVGKWCGVALAASAAFLCVSLAPAGASAASFVQGANLPPCMGEHHEVAERDRVVVSRDGTTAAWNECVYTRPEGSWEIQAALLPISPPWGISDDGNTLNTFRDGIFTRSGETWSQQTATDFDAISGDGNTAVRVLEQSHTGKKKTLVQTYPVQVYARSGEVWSLQAEFTQTISGEGYFGAQAEAVALSDDGDTLIVGAPYQNKSKGAAYIYVRSGESWTLQATVTPSGEKGKGTFGSGVTLSEDGSTALIAADFDRGAHGAVWAFTRSGATWSQQAELNAGHVKNETFFGDSMALSSDGNTALIGASGQPPGKKQEPGAAFVFERSGGSWTAAQTLRPNGEEVPENGFGWQVALSGDGKTAFVLQENEYKPVTEPPTVVTAWTR